MGRELPIHNAPGTEQPGIPHSHGAGPDNDRDHEVDHVLARAELGGDFDEAAHETGREAVTPYDHHSKQQGLR